MKKIKEEKREKDMMISVRVPGYIIATLKDFDVNVSEVVNEALRDKLLKEIKRSRKK